MTDSQQLLAQYLETGSEAAFHELLTRYVNLVYSAAVRLAEGDTHCAEDITQTVFADLARTAQNLSKDVQLGGWLHRHTCFVASNVMRRERRRLARERRAAEMNLDPIDTAFTQLDPLLDEAINQLGTEDRTAIVLRFFEQLDFRSVGEALGSSEDAAKKRVSRALDKLHALLTARGVTLSATTLAAALLTGAVKAAPAGLVTSITAATLGGASATSGSALTLLNIMTTSKLSISFAGVILVASLAFSARQHLTQSKLRAENNALRQQSAELTAQLQDLSSQLAQATNDQSAANAQFRDLMRLRGQVAVLKSQLADAARARAKAPSPSPQELDPQEQAHQVAMRRAHDAKILSYAFRTYAADHQDQYPTNFAQAMSYFEAALRNDLNPGDAMRDQAEFAQVTNQFEIAYQGSYTNLASLDVIVLREKQPTQLPDGSWVRVYGMADGSGQAPTGPTANFDAWEQQHMAKPSPGR
jgi:RNA polymerase sigma factor (sigma-70 family)